MMDSGSENETVVVESDDLYDSPSILTGLFRIRHALPDCDQDGPLIDESQRHSHSPVLSMAVTSVSPQEELLHSDDASVQSLSQQSDKSLSIFTQRVPGKRKSPAPSNDSPVFELVPALKLPRGASETPDSDSTYLSVQSHCSGSFKETSSQLENGAIIADPLPLAQTQSSDATTFRSLEDRVEKPSQTDASQSLSSLTQCPPDRPQAPETLSPMQSQTNNPGSLRSSPMPFQTSQPDVSPTLGSLTKSQAIQSDVSQSLRGVVQSRTNQPDVPKGPGSLKQSLTNQPIGFQTLSPMHAQTNQSLNSPGQFQASQADASQTLNNLAQLHETQPEAPHQSQSNSVQSQSSRPPVSQSLSSPVQSESNQLGVSHQAPGPVQSQANGPDGSQIPHSGMPPQVINRTNSQTRSPVQPQTNSPDISRNSLTAQSPANHPDVPETCGNSTMQSNVNWSQTNHPDVSRPLSPACRGPACRTAPPPEKNLRSSTDGDLQDEDQCLDQMEKMQAEMRGNLSRDSSANHQGKYADQVRRSLLDMQAKLQQISTRQREHRRQLSIRLRQQSSEAPAAGNQQQQQQQQHQEVAHSQLQLMTRRQQRLLRLLQSHKDFAAAVRSRDPTDFSASQPSQTSGGSSEECGREIRASPRDSSQEDHPPLPPRPSGNPQSVPQHHHQQLPLPAPASTAQRRGFIPAGPHAAGHHQPNPQDPVTIISTISRPAAEPASSVRPFKPPFKSKPTAAGPHQQPALPQSTPSLAERSNLECDLVIPSNTTTTPHIPERSPSTATAVLPTTQESSNRSSSISTNLQNAAASAPGAHQGELRRESLNATRQTPVMVPVHSARNQKAPSRQRSSAASSLPYPSALQRQKTKRSVCPQNEDSHSAQEPTAASAPALIPKNTPVVGPQMPLASTPAVTHQPLNQARAQQDAHFDPLITPTSAPNPKKAPVVGPEMPLAPTPAVVHQPLNQARTPQDTHLDPLIMPTSTPIPKKAPVVGPQMPLAPTPAVVHQPQNQARTPQDTRMDPHIKPTSASIPKRAPVVNPQTPLAPTPAVIHQPLNQARTPQDTRMDPHITPTSAPIPKRAPVVSPQTPLASTPAVVHHQPQNQARTPQDTRMDPLITPTSAPIPKKATLGSAAQPPIQDTVPSLKDLLETNLIKPGENVLSIKYKRGSSSVSASINPDGTVSTSFGQKTFSHCSLDQLLSKVKRTSVKALHQKFQGLWKTALYQGRPMDKLHDEYRALMMRGLPQPDHPCIMTAQAVLGPPQPATSVIYRASTPPARPSSGSSHPLPCVANQNRTVTLYVSDLVLSKGHGSVPSRRTEPTSSSGRGPASSSGCGPASSSGCGPALATVCSISTSRVCGPALSKGCGPPSSKGCGPAISTRCSISATEGCGPVPSKGWSRPSSNGCGPGSQKERTPALTKGRVPISSSDGPAPAMDRNPVSSNGCGTFLTRGQGPAPSSKGPALAPSGSRPTLPFGDSGSLAGAHHRNLVSSLQRVLLISDEELMPTSWGVLSPELIRSPADIWAMPINPKWVQEMDVWT